MTTQATPTEPLTDDMIRTLRSESAAAGDAVLAALCDHALHGSIDSHVSRSACAEAITAARATDDSRPFVRVVA